MVSWWVMNEALKKLEFALGDEEGLGSDMGTSGLACQK